MNLCRPKAMQLSKLLKLDESNILKFISLRSLSLLLKDTLTYLPEQTHFWETARSHFDLSFLCLESVLHKSGLWFPCGWTTHAKKMFWSRECGYFLYRVLNFSPWINTASVWCLLWSHVPLSVSWFLCPAPAPHFLWDACLLTDVCCYSRGGVGYWESNGNMSSGFWKLVLVHHRHCLRYSGRWMRKRNKTGKDMMAPSYSGGESLSWINGKA